eukprot:13838196-Ditylum_brightwellii.AAC.1
MPFTYQFPHFKVPEECHYTIAVDIFIDVTHYNHLISFFFPFLNVALEIIHERIPQALESSYGTEVGDMLGVDQSCTIY